jgi:hypothetical protein
MLIFDSRTELADANSIGHEKRLRRDQWSRLERNLWEFTERHRFQARIIRNDDGSPYLLRVYLTPRKPEELRKRPAPWLHYFFRGDLDRECHNHPFQWAASLILTGGYVEERRMPDDRVLTFERKPGQVNFLKANTYHRVKLNTGRCWTLFLAGPRVDKPRDESWGFWDAETGAYEHHQARIDRLQRERGSWV